VTDQDATNTAITTIDLLRHGECEGGHCYRGSINVALSPQGVERMVQRVNHVTQQYPVIWQAIITSPLIRCEKFAHHLSQQHQLPLQSDAALQEMHFGDWEGELIEHIWNTQSSAVEQWFTDPVNCPPPNGEAADKFAARVTACFLAFVRQHQGQHLLCVTHGGVMRVLLAHCLSMSLLDMHRFDIPYACLSRIQVIQTADSSADGDEIYYRLVAHNIGSELDEK
jgi:alpha-ribazole phosphatase